MLGHPAVNGSAGLFEVFTREYWGRPLAQGWSSSYRPLTSLGFALEHRITSAPWLHHLVGVLAYAVLCGQVVLLARRWSSRAAALAAGLLFAVLPIHVEVAASIVGRADVLAAMLSIAALMWALPRVDRSDTTWSRVVLGAVAYLAALLCKESAAPLPALAVWLAWVQPGAPRRRGATFVGPAALALVGLSYLLWRRAALPVGLPADFVAADNLLILREGWLRLWGQLAVLGHCAEITTVPLRLCADHTYGDVFPPTDALGVGAARGWLGLVLALALVLDGVAALRGRSRGLWFALACSYLLVGHWLMPLSVILAERLALWPSVWLVVALAATLGPRLEPLPRSRLLVLSLCAVLAVRFVARTLDWRDELTLHQSSLDACPRAMRSHFTVAKELRGRGEVDAALWHFAVAAAGRDAFPAPFESPLLEAELDLPLAERLPRIPALVGARDASAYWAAFHRFLVGQGYLVEAERVRALAGASTP